MLHSIIHDLRSPLRVDHAVIAAVSGSKTSRLRRLEREVIDTWGGLYLPSHERVLIDTLAALRFVVSSQEPAIQPYAFKWFVRHRRQRFRTNPAIVRLKTRGHLIAVWGDLFADGEHREPVDLGSAPSNWKVVEILYLDKVA